MYIDSKKSLPDQIVVASKESSPTETETKQDLPKRQRDQFKQVKSYSSVSESSRDYRITSQYNKIINKEAECAAPTIDLQKQAPKPRAVIN
jgi:hypothetical protein